MIANHQRHHPRIMSRAVAYQGMEKLKTEMVNSTNENWKNEVEEMKEETKD